MESYTVKSFKMGREVGDLWVTFDYLSQVEPWTSRLIANRLVDEIIVYHVNRSNPLGKVIQHFKNGEWQ